MVESTAPNDAATGAEPDVCHGRRVLVVDDDPVVVDIVSRYLVAAGCVVETAADGPGAVAACATTAPDLVVLDILLPGFDGLEVFRRIRVDTSAPVIMLTALDGTDDRVAGLELGADDYLAKPFSPRELMARIRNLLRRGAVAASAQAPEVLVADDLRIDVGARRVDLGGRTVALTTLELDLLAHLVRHRGTALARDDLFAAVWGYSIGDTATVTVHIRRVREKIEVEPTRPVRIATVWGYGYRFDG